MKLYYLYAVFLIVYCILHSVLADYKVIGKIYHLWWYRFFYVFLSTVLLIPLFGIYFKLPKEEFFYPPLPYRLFLYLVGAIGLFVGYIASKSYDNDSFLGLKQIKQYFKNREKYHYESTNLITDKGILSIVRHPYYLAGILILWGRPLYVKDFITNIIFTLYFILGAINEERKLINVFGDTYKEYKKNVPMLFPKVKIKK
ncbi:isoprenylcysteine carboxylmethyltransferase family protein [Deferribacterales bacterium Es71-Z0220]|uniref:methyltransferase family protein n=1 Tax=Deferrivibrio essentukiensis TaxID=2880922 RepID=UPI001F61396F|nr:isoprenylcysteine carboxylmethyltransferase family protein [Deferrivibrio essentukiensis]MCB4204119.1 isoprenylcysteine carboxylmethyltransferase family protein [Deferrivibrio essentukiensis]